ncbi:unnamed protein product [Effrenium voratum]|nr:unnamed protein product [Effrenium voratum]
MAKLNSSLLRRLGMGAFHAGVEVLGDEWYFRWDETAESGVVWMTPRAHQVHIYSESVCLGDSALSEGQIRSVLGEMVDQWPANSYHPVRRNCIHFAQAFVKGLQCPEPFPDWVTGLPDAANSSLISPIAELSWDWLKWWNSTPSGPEDAWLQNEEVEEVVTVANGHTTCQITI